LLGGNKDPAFIPSPYVQYLVKIRHGGLWLGPYTAYQKALSDRVIQLREVQGLTFLAIADQLISEGYNSPRGKELSAESVFSIYKKRGIRDKRLHSAALIRVLQVNF
jgi:hypothetical protein